MGAPRAFGGALARAASAGRSAFESAAAVSSNVAAVPQGASTLQRAFSSPATFLRSRPASSPWQQQSQSQSARLSNSSSAMAAAQAWQHAVMQQEHNVVEDWLTALHQVDHEARDVCTGLLQRHPEVLHRDPQRVAATVQALVDATRARRLLKPWFTQDANVLAIVDRYTPEGLRARLAELHRMVWQRLDDAGVASIFATRSSLDMLDLEARSLARKAERLQALIPEFLPSTVLRACPELLDVSLEELSSYVRRAGNVVVVGEQVSAELVTINNVVIVRSRHPVGSTASQPSTSGSMPATAGRLLRTARCGAQQLLQEQQMAAPFIQGGAAVRENVKAFCNHRCLVVAGPTGMEVRVEDPSKAQEELSAACRTAVLQGFASAAAQAAGVRA